MKTKIPAYTFLKALGLTDKKIVYSLKEIDYLKKIIKNTNNKDAIENISETMLNKKTNILRIKFSTSYL